jgi:hypothetical protein
MLSLDRLSDLVAYAFPLRDGHATLYLPRDGLTEPEADRLCRYVHALVTGAEPEGAEDER